MTHGHTSFQNQFSQNHELLVVTMISLEVICKCNDNFSASHLFQVLKTNRRILDLVMLRSSH